MAIVSRLVRRANSSAAASPYSEAFLFGKGAGLHGVYHSSAATDPTAAVVVAHGIHQHSGVYELFAQRLVQEGFAVVAYDHRGFGQSASYDGFGRSQIAEWVKLDVPSAAGDMADACLKAKELSGCDRVYVFGHSLGGLAAGLLGTSEVPTADGFILSNPTLQWHGQPAGEAAAEGLPLPSEEIARERSLAKAEPEQVVGSFSPATNSSSPAFIDFWTGDTVSRHIEPGMPVKQAYWTGVLVDAIPTVRSRFHRWTSPALLLRGEEDIGTLGRSDLPGCELGSCLDLMAGADASADFSFMSYPSLRHEVIFEKYPMMLEPGTNEVVDHCVGWLKAMEVR